jgi:hypothetical protein
MSFSLPKLGVPSPVTTGIHFVKMFLFEKIGATYLDPNPPKPLYSEEKISVSTGKWSKVEYSAH